MNTTAATTIASKTNPVRSRCSENENFQQAVKDSGLNIKLTQELSSRISSLKIDHVVQFNAPEGVQLPYTDPTSFHHYDGEGDYAEFIESVQWNDDIEYQLYLAALKQLEELYGDNIFPIYDIFLVQAIDKTSVTYTATVRLEYIDQPKGDFKDLNELKEWISKQYQRIYNNTVYDQGTIPFETPDGIQKQFDSWLNNPSSEKNKNAIICYLDRTNMTNGVVTIKKIFIDENGIVQ